ncbi:MAG: hypothetical protein HC846_11025 [Blastocatellia bacterium]|nr:hypothetical protein [Blastocatellia bacterium]
MFGLMRAKTCGMTAEEKNFRRLHYCGTCKTIGSLYGNKSRMLLNHDTVFLAEILTSLSDEKVENWEKSYQSYNCLSLPKNEMPVSLQFAATANVILTEFKIADHVSDTRQRRFKLAHRIFSKEFLEAQKRLNDWNFPLEKVRTLLETQEKRETKNSNLDELALPTATATATFFEEGVKLIGRNELSNLAREIGFNFGKLIYVLDAYEDFKKDAKTNQFNALRSAFGEKEKGISILLELENEIINRIYELPISETRKQLFASRLRSNLQKKIQAKLPKIVCQPKKRLTFAERFERAKIRAKELTANYSWATALPLFIFVLAIAFVAPTQAREAKSARECAELGFNLMFLGSMIGFVLAIPKNLMQGYTPPDTQKIAEEVDKKQREGWCSYCDCDCCDCCDCGCDSCDCCSGCDCCDCSCD